MSERVREILALARYPKPIQLSPKSVGISEVSRLFSVQNVHDGVLGSIKTDGHDPDRPQVGICVEARTPAARRSLVEHNKMLSGLSQLMPSVDEDAMEYEGLACTHYNTALRLALSSTHDTMYLRAMNENHGGDMDPVD